MRRQNNTYYPLSQQQPQRLTTVAGRLGEEYASAGLLCWIGSQKLGFLGAVIMISITCVRREMCGKIELYIHRSPARLSRGSYPISSRQHNPCFVGC